MKRALVDCMFLKPGETVTTVTTDLGDPRVIDAIGDVTREQGAHPACTITIDPLPSETEDPRGEPPKAAMDAMKNSDLVVLHAIGMGGARGYVGRLIWSQSIVELVLDYPTRIILVPDSNYLTSREGMWPLTREVERWLWNRFQGREKLRITNENGTDIEWGPLEPEAFHNICFSPYQALKERARPKVYFYPPFEIGWHPLGRGSGKLVWDGAVPFGYVKTPIKATISDGIVTKIDGGSEANVFDKIIRKLPGDSVICEVSFGFNPKSVMPSLKHAGVMHFGVGIEPCKTMPGSAIRTHLDMPTLKTDVYWGKEKVVEGGHFMVFDEMRNDKEFLDRASQYGDPQELLSEEFAGGLYYPI
jgi:hypothetical protein